MKVVGLTGGVATGKSTVAELLRARGVPVLDADVAARAIVEPGQPALGQIVDAFGEDILQGDGTLDRAALRAIIVADAEARQTLNRITHPAIALHLGQALQALAAEGHEVAVVEAALMVETGSYRQYDGVIVVTCAPDTQLARLLARDGTSAEDARRLVRAQMPLADKEAVADVLIRNDGDTAQLARETDRAWGRMLEHLTG